MSDDAKKTMGQLTDETAEADHGGAIETEAQKKADLVFPAGDQKPKRIYTMLDDPRALQAVAAVVGVMTEQEKTKQAKELTKQKREDTKQQTEETNQQREKTSQAREQTSQARESTAQVDKVTSATKWRLAISGLVAATGFYSMAHFQTAPLATALIVVAVGGGVHLEAFAEKVLEKWRGKQMKP